MIAPWLVQEWLIDKVSEDGGVRVRIWRMGAPWTRNILEQLPSILSRDPAAPHHRLSCWPGLKVSWRHPNPCGLHRELYRGGRGWHELACPSLSHSLGASVNQGRNLFYFGLKLVNLDLHRKHYYIINAYLSIWHIIYFCSFLMQCRLILFKKFLIFFCLPVFYYVCVCDLMFVNFLFSVFLFFCFLLFFFVSLFFCISVFLFFLFFFCLLFFVILFFCFSVFLFFVFCFLFFCFSVYRFVCISLSFLYIAPMGNLPLL